MKRHFVRAIILVAGFLTLRAQMPPQGPPLKLEDVQKALCLVEKPGTVPDKYKTGFEAITPKETLAMLSYLSSDWMEGRETGTSGYAQAADYAASLFKMWGLKPAGDFPPAPRSSRRFGVTPPPATERSYFQNIAFKEISDVQSRLTVEVAKGPGLKTRVYTGGVDYATVIGPAETVTAPVVFAGYGISEPSVGFDELKGLDLKGKIVLILTEAPGKDDPKSPFQANKELKEKYFPVFQGYEAMMRRGGGPPRFSKVEEIRNRGAAAVVLVDNTARDKEIFRDLSTVEKPSDDRPIIDKPRLRLQIAGDASVPMGGGSAVTVTREIADAILAGTGQTVDDLKKKIETTMKPASLNLPGTRMTLATTAKTALVQSPNVLAMIEGSDPDLKNECFVIGAHLDHLGNWEDYVFNGADDNGSGSAGVLAIARAMTVNPVKPKRTVLFALWTGEEKGLYGSRFYVANPFFPLAKTVGYLNYDMISRAYDEPGLARAVRRYNVAGAEDMVKKIRADRFANVYVTAGTDFVPLTREMNAYVGLDLAFQESPLGAGSGGSDHAPFASAKIPFVYFMSAMTSDYHQTSDSVEKVDAELFTKICRIGYLTSFAIADK